ncbi:hypothetical protein MIND_00789500 [Mycena indigotica]|uniref:tRNA (uracil-O(2)-)-methyltransferase n=1 Tax=Mycena indigotica TaxID=2126181 RepID=A0A8H6SM03_9AGAR|nr:uncharacterized protein MIND_00789500 [Mycena indigotica]KAF7302225.1 hypothetical protein MIND_00789500 [Mycena indigotica]
MTSSRPRFEPLPCVDINLPALSSSWKPLLWSAADFPPEIFESAVSQLVNHPEYNSTLILRSEIIAETSDEFPAAIPALDGLTPIKTIHRRLLPRRPTRDAALEQYCTLYGLDGTPSTLVLTPIIPNGGSLPYYHPPVSNLAFRYLETTPPTLRVEMILLSPDETPTDPNSRLYRTGLALLDAIHRYGWGVLSNYQKRVNHDRVVAREAYQDLYLIMREKFKHIVDNWVETTDPLKHVFEDIGIATFLMVLWRDTYPALDASHPDEPWRGWGRPPGGFLDFGCGNGLLTHILLSCGYIGRGVDLRARNSWSTYPQSTQDHLVLDSFNPSILETTQSIFSTPDQFVIANHADELTPWTPILATLTRASGFINIPCCPWVLDARFQREKGPGQPVPLETLNLGAGAGISSGYVQYRMWLAQLCQHCGWEIECEMLRIPSTRNWAIVARRQTDGIDAKANAEEILETINERGSFKPRKPEGKAH